MAVIQVRNLNFTYPTTDKKALSDISFDVNESEFVVLCGKSGCGKSTLLRHLKKNLTPYGEISGEVLYDGQKISTLDDRINASEIGFVQQNPDNQLVTDKVWHELAFGLESLGLDNQTIKRRVAEMANFFDIQTWFRKNVTELSGGQKQLLNLASIMVMQPKILILDEPTSQLDPIAASEFIKTIYKINRELGTTIIISEHRLEELFTMADRVLVMDGGELIANDTPYRIGSFLGGNNGNEKHPMFYGLPAIMKTYSEAIKSGAPKFFQGGDEMSPLTIRDGRLWLESVIEKSKAKFDEPMSITTEKMTVGSMSKIVETKKESREPIIKLKDIWFRYERNSNDILRGLSLDIYPNEMFCLLGGNGAGKSTTLKSITGEILVQSGTVTVDGIKVKKQNQNELFDNRLAMLPQNPQALFTEITVEEELLEALYYQKISDEAKVLEIEKILDMMEIKHLRKSHPYDLSGGEQQRLALGKILLLKPKILLLDEPTKGLDPFFKITLSKIFKKLKSQGLTIFMVSHDIEFCAEYADRCAMFFDGEIASIGEPRKFFSGNNFYTTSSNRIARKWVSDLITWEEVAHWAEQITTTED